MCGVIKKSASVFILLSDSGPHIESFDVRVTPKRKHLRPDPMSVMVSYFLFI